MALPIDPIAKPPWSADFPACRPYSALLKIKIRFNLTAQPATFIDQAHESGLKGEHRARKLSDMHRLRRLQASLPDQVISSGKIFQDRRCHLHRVRRPQRFPVLVDVCLSGCIAAA
ncbi:MAG: hypothetical protein IPF44_09670 [Betaproteobacteria bacterium]|nr:hypothetical protein [Betaproteobacteria bacterium]